MENDYKATRQHILARPEDMMRLLISAIAALRRGTAQEAAGETPTGLYDANTVARELVTKLEALFDSD